MQKWKQEAEALRCGSGSAKVVEADAGSGSETVIWKRKH